MNLFLLETQKLLCNFGAPSFLGKISKKNLHEKEKKYLKK